MNTKRTSGKSSTGVALVIRRCSTAGRIPGHAPCPDEAGGFDGWGVSPSRQIRPRPPVAAYTSTTALRSAKEAETTGRRHWNYSAPPVTLWSTKRTSSESLTGVALGIRRCLITERMPGCAPRPDRDSSPQGLRALPGLVVPSCPNHVMVVRKDRYHPFLFSDVVARSWR